jgi:hypothetical protein
MELKGWIQPIITGIVLLLLTHVADSLSGMTNTLRAFELHMMIDDIRHKNQEIRLTKLENL